ncbi:T9SS type B sorting domain-containing protein [Bizionia myxarmorum]|uniref:T9SS type B sorting domain-containing protein n=1 Tax=Bizionia myxarmorum TaxID=291186 RepID=A0A5D0REK5_9FLAO|nr:T9SS type B sorting domain-containing protein [Bizionia myxarmorum]
MLFRLKKHLCFLFLCVITYNLQAQAPTDCVDAVTVCGNSEINLNVNGIGTQELNGLNNCGSYENNSLWLKVTLVTDGTLGFILTPQSTNIREDYDFFVFGPNAVCGNLSPAIRCSTTNPQAANQGNNLTGMIDTATNATSGGPGELGDSFVEWLTVTAGDTYFIVIDRPVGNSPFNLEWIGTAEFASPPVNEASNSGDTTALNLEKCDVVAPNTDGRTTFDLSLNTNQITGSQTNVSVTYFRSESDANINVGEIIGLFTNTTNPQEVYAKITDNATGCFEIIPFDLTVNPGPDFNVPTDYNLCDNTDDGDAANGRIVFNLDSKNNEILNGQNASEFNVSYHKDLLDAEVKADPFPNAYYNDTAFQEVIFVRIESISNPTCYSTTQLTLNVLPLPEAFNASQTQCSDDAFGVFNLNNSFETLTGNTPNRSVKFYRNLVDAQSETNDITNFTNFENTSNPQIIIAQVINTTTGCSSFSELTLNVSNTLVSNSVITTCDDDGTEDGLHAFNLSDVEGEILNGLPANLNVTYYEFLEDAYAQENPIDANFTNNIPNSQTVYARVDNANDCFGIAEIELIVNPLPSIPEDDFLYYCLNSFPATITIDAGTTSSNYDFSWSTGETTSTININTTGTFTVTVTDRVTNCSKQRNIIVEPSNIATIESFEIVDASDANTVTIIVSGEGEYEFALFNANGTIYANYQSSNQFTNVRPGIYSVSVRDIKNNCGLVDDMVSVIGFPKFFTPNGDGDNDTWNIQGVSALFQPNTRILIYNRFGKLLKELSPLGSGWNGTYNGQVLPNDDYWFSVQLQDGRIFKSHFTLKR